jgi:hypothetical protein
LQYYGTVQSKVTGTDVPTFDFVSIQLYESYTHAVYNVSVLGTPPAEYVVSFVQQVLAGWEVDFSALSPPPPHHAPAAGSSPSPGHISSPSGKGKMLIPASQLVIGA